VATGSQAERGSHLRYLCRATRQIFRRQWKHCPVRRYAVSPVGGHSASVWLKGEGGEAQRRRQLLQLLLLLLLGLQRGVLLMGGICTAW
jgi:hypothetical protein